MHDTEARDPINAFIRREPIAAMMLGVAFLLCVLLVTGGIVWRIHGNIRLLEAALLATGAFSVAGAAIGLVRGLRSRPLR